MSDIYLNEDGLQTKHSDRSFLCTIAVLAALEIGVLLWVIF